MADFDEMGRRWKNIWDLSARNEIREFREQGFCCNYLQLQGGCGEPA
ncbi:MAG: hypothetical protein GY850_34755 [bacterium]|nr:hypothetical protein [bacterium]